LRHSYPLRFTHNEYVSIRFEQLFLRTMKSFLLVACVFGICCAVLVSIIVLLIKFICVDAHSIFNFVSTPQTFFIDYSIALKMTNSFLFFSGRGWRTSRKALIKPFLRGQFEIKNSCTKSKNYPEQCKNIYV